MYDRDVAAFLERLALEARGEWGYRSPLVHPDIEIRMHVCNSSKDRDGIWTTVLDALKQARVIWDDSIRWYNGRELKLPAEVVANQRLERIHLTLTARKLGATDA